jgi:DNA repair protein RecN (Recombination protein N)
MLKSLFISNYALINELSVDFTDGMTALTGETGAGKSIIIGALSLILGQRADTKTIKEGESKSTLEVNFDIERYKLQHFFDENELDYSPETIIRREITSNGKSRAFINDTPVQLNILRELGSKLLDIHSQHENLLLSNEDYQLNVVDTIANNRDLREDYVIKYKNWLDAKKELKILQTDVEKQKQEEDYLKFQLEQLDEANLIENEQEELEQEQETLSNVELIKTELQNALQNLESDEINAVSAIKDAGNAIRKIDHFLSENHSISERIEQIFIELKDISQELNSYQDKIDFNPEKLEFIDNRLSLLYQLQKKNRVDSVAELIQIREKWRAQLQKIENFEEEIQKAQKRVVENENELRESANRLSQSRNTIILEIEENLIEILKRLGMVDIQFQIQLAPLQNYSESGMDQATFLFSANKNRTMQPVAEIASGGEISRFMLAIKSMTAQKSDLPTIVFDEIDSGVSGDIAGRMGNIMKLLGKHSQVIVITHLPQIAAKANDHFSVFKDNTTHETITHIKRLNEEERMREIAQMLSGTSITEAALANAKELLKNH